MRVEAISGRGSRPGGGAEETEEGAAEGAPEAGGRRFADRLLVEQLRRGDAGAGYRFFGGQYPGIYRYLLWLTERPEVAEDLAQETFPRASPDEDGPQPAECGMGIIEVQVWRAACKEERMNQLRSHAVPVVPNASRIRGRLLQREPEPDGRGSVWTVAIDEAHDVDGMPNFARAYIGQPIQVYVHPDLQPELAARDPLEAQVAYRGDERGGRFVIVNNEVHRR